MKWVNPQQKYCFVWHDPFAKSGIIVYILVVCWLYFLWIILRYSQIGVIHFWHNVTLYLSSKWSHLIILYKLPMMIYSNISRKLHSSITKGSYINLILFTCLNFCSEIFTVLDNWYDKEMTPSTMRLYGKKNPAREAS